MSDEVKESAQEIQEPVEQPVPPVPSVPSGVEPTSAQDSGDDVLERLAQSIKDKRFASQEKDIGEIKETLSKLTNLIEGGQSGTQEVQGRTSGVNEWAYAEAKSAQYLEEAGLELDDSEFTALAERYAGKVTPEQWLDIAETHCNKRATKLTKQASVTEAAVVVPGGSVAGAVSEGSVEDLADELEQIQMGERGSPFLPENQKKAQELVEKINELEPKVDLDDPNVRIDRASLSRLYK